MCVRVCVHVQYPANWISAGTHFIEGIKKHDCGLLLHFISSFKQYAN